MATNYYKFRKNWGGGILAIQLTDSPGYPDDPLYDEIAVELDHTLPGSDPADGSTMDDVFRLVIWSGGTNPGGDPSLEVVEACRTDHPRVYQITERGLENTDIVPHPVGSFVGLHYTAGVSEHDLAPIQAILDAVVGSIIYTWSDVFANKEIGILPPGTNGMVLHTAGVGQPPYWDWVYGYANRTFRVYIYTGHDLTIITMSKLWPYSIDETNLYTEYTTDAYDIEVEILDSFVEGGIAMDYFSEVLNVSGDSSSEPITYGQVDESNVTTGGQVNVDDVEQLTFGDWDIGT